MICASLYFFLKGFLPFLTKQKYHILPPAAAITTIPPITHQRTVLPEPLLSDSDSTEVTLTSLPDSSNSTGPQGSEDSSDSEDSGSSEDSALLSGVSEEFCAEFSDSVL